MQVGRGQVEFAHLQPGVAKTMRPRPDLLDFRAHHQRRQAAGALLPGVAGCRHFALPQDCGALTQALHFLQLVRNIGDCLALCLEAIQNGKQRLGFLRRQHGCRLVQNQQFRLLQQAAGDFDALAFASRKAPHRTLRLESQAIALADRLDARRQPFAACGSRQHQRDILRHRQILEQGKMLEHHADPQRPGCNRVWQRHHLPGKADGAGVRLD